MRYGVCLIPSGVLVLTCDTANAPSLWLIGGGNQKEELKGKVNGDDC